MRHLRLSAALAGVVAVCVLATSPETSAATVISLQHAPGSVCQLSIPTTDTGVRPKATGFRNESTTTGNFVICPLVSPMATGSDAFTFVNLSLLSLDGQSHDVACSAVANAISPAYSSKTISVNASGGSYQWSASDFGETFGSPIIGSQEMSITCLLPPQAAIRSVGAYYNREIGN
ncbi:hypothetical protein FNZ56_07760 [Pseudoluteimonas lycopersici]|uniref:Spore coat protein U domain-containing protein n=1 Tax=Pseudoluteimonas lycopersici TaxID=1324796 RepID=A0A516V5G4_9GAMM|nr:hypothetical protein [Lysobacter lycopersici]QDQ73776.1 hypothetical protein FNZ56_07760 [Lysobacter lycopersici]